MPELPEIEIICQDLRSKILNNKIIKAIKLSEFNLRQAIPTDIADNVVNSHIIDINRIAKYINISLDNDFSILIHLGMSGKLLLKDHAHPLEKHDHFTLQLNNGQQLIYNDARRFGLVSIYKTSQLKHCPLFDRLGVEPLSSDFTNAYLAKILANKKQPIKLAIMDNHNIVGVGNIYAAESLFLSKIAPTRISSSLTSAEITSLHKNIIIILQQAIRQGGSSIKDFSSVNGENGYFQHFFNVYDRAGQNCKICGTIIIKLKQAGRSSFYCPECQK